MTKRNTTLQVLALAAALTAGGAAQAQVDLRSQGQIRQDAALASFGDHLANNPKAPRDGAATADAVIIEFFDYACGYCRYNHPKLQRILRSEENVRVVYQPFPILDPTVGPQLSTLGAKLALAAQEDGDFPEFHRIMMERRVRLSEDYLLAAARDAGLSDAQIEAARSSRDIENYIEEVAIMANTLRISGTPAYVIGGRVYRGAIDEDVMRHAAGLPQAATE